MLPPALLIVFAALPILVLRYTVYMLLAKPLWPLIQRLGWVYQDKPMFLTPEATVLTAVVWAVPLFVLLCALRHSLARRG
jgi:hypothetical protein